MSGLSRSLAIISRVLFHGFVFGVVGPLVGTASALLFSLVSAVFNADLGFETTQSLPVVIFFALLFGLMIGGLTAFCIGLLMGIIEAKTGRQAGWFVTVALAVAIPALAISLIFPGARYSSLSMLVAFILLPSIVAAFVCRSVVARALRGKGRLAKFLGGDMKPSGS